MTRRLTVVLLFATLLSVPSFAGLLTGTNSGTAQCNGNDVVLSYSGLYHSNGNAAVPFSIDVTVTGATVNQTVCQNGYAIYYTSGSSATIGFSAPSITGTQDSTAYTNVFNTSDSPRGFGDLNYYNGNFSFTDTTTGTDFSANYFSVASTSSITDGFQMPNDQLITFDPSGALVVWANTGAPNVILATPEPGTLALVIPALGALAAFRRKFIA